MAEQQKIQDDLNKIFQIPVGAYNFANNTKWIYSIPLGYLLSSTSKKQVDGNILEYPLNCRKVSFPNFTIGTAKTAFLSYGFDISTRQNTTEKGLTIEFLVSSNWIQYLLLLKWFQLMDYTYYDNSTNQDRTFDKNTNTKNNYLNPYDSTQGPMFPSNLYLMDNFNHRLVTIVFQRSWLSNLKSIDLNYSNTSDTQVSSSFELKFFKYDIIINDELLKQIFPDIQVS